MRIVTWNVNGVRQIVQKNISQWLGTTSPDILCLQEIKAEASQFFDVFAPDLFSPSPYHLYANAAERKGYSGVGVLSKQQPLSVKLHLGLERFDSEGRMIHLEYADFALINVYVPHGGREKENLPYKLHVYEKLIQYLANVTTKHTIVLGDFNVAHHDLDLSRPAENRNSTMFTPEERRQLDRIVELGYVDSFRQLHPDGGHYTWWPYSAVARQDPGWRIDYVFISESLVPRLKEAFILPGVRGSDHCPSGIEV